MGIYRDQVVPRVADVALRGREFARLRERIVQGLSGEVLEVGFGSGRNVPHYPSSIQRVVAVEPSAVGRRLARKRIEASPVAVELVGMEGEHLPFEDGSVDHALTTWTLCTIPDVRSALEEIRRVLRPGGTFHFLEHGRSPVPEVAVWQDRLTPLQRRLAGGCHLNRPIAELVEDAGFDLLRLDNCYMKGPRVFGYMYEGVARPS